MKVHCVEPEPWAVDLFPRRPLAFLNTPHPHTTFAFRHVTKPLAVICSARTEADGKRWMHVSCSRPRELPNWHDLRLVKDTFIGRDRQAILLIPKQDEHVNIHNYVHHLWSCLDGDGLPDFRIEGQV